MKTSILIASLALLSALSAAAQTPVNKSIPATPGQTVEFRFDYPDLVKISTWDKNEISITGTVSINGGDSDAAFELESSASGDKITVRNYIRDMKNLPHRITITRDDQKMTFKTRADFNKYKQENGGSSFSFNSMNEGLDMDIKLEIKVPKGMKTKVESTYGMVEVKDFAGPLKVDATYGGVDATVGERSTGDLTASTNYGEIYTNLTVKFSTENRPEENFHTEVSAKLGGGPSYSLESKYGNVYLRKPVTQ